VSSGGVTGIAAYGGLYKTEEFLPPGASLNICPAGQQFQWQDVRGSSFDGLDRVLNKYELAFGNDPKMINIYDGTSEAGLLSETENTPQSGTHQTINYTYDAMARVQEADIGGVAPPEDSRSYTFDADGRTLTITTQTLGQLSYVYDVDGNLTSESDPSLENNASTISYTNYPDGLREYLSISSPNGPFNQQQPLFTYSYREDGRLHNQYVNWNQSQGTFTWVYTPGGRELTEADPYDTPGNPPTTVATTYTATQATPEPGQTTYGTKQYGYDPYGRVSSLLYPETYQADTMLYDADDELSDMSASKEKADGGRTLDALAYNYILSDRGELLSEVTCQTQCSTNDYAQSANGTLVDPAGHAQNTNAAESWQTLSGASLINASLVAPRMGGGTNTYTYDASGRQITDTLTPPQGANYPNPIPYQRTYDAENHLVSAPTGPACNPNNTTVSCYADAALTWGPDGQLRLIAQSDPTAQGWPATQSSDLHWDGTTLLFTTVKQSGYPGQTTLYIGKAAVTAGDGGFLVADRDQNGVEEAWHTSSTYSAWNNFSYNIVGGGRFGVSSGVGINWGSCWSANPNYPCPAPFLPPAAPNGLLVDFSRADGYSFGTYAVQGVRTYDSTSQQWLTPDAFAGDVDDPMSQKPFMWNGNNALEWNDPDVQPRVMPRIAGAVV
jgi:YD repeat-containing protein